jgi:hypothetical protein
MIDGIRGGQGECAGVLRMGLPAKDVSRVPLANDATLRTPLNPAGGESALVRGHKAILDLFTSILPAIWRQLVGQFGREIRR